MRKELDTPSEAPSFLTTATTVPIRKQSVADLIVPSGRIIACDPGSFEFEDDQRPFHRAVPPGPYPTTTGLVQSGRFEIPAYFMIEFTQKSAIRWQLATRLGTEPAAASSAAHFVDSGCSCFMDADAALRLANGWAERIYRGRLLDVMLKRLPPQPWAAIVLDPTTGANLVACTSGYGDGAYTSYWGIDAQGTVTCLVTDFGVTAP